MRIPGSFVLLALAGWLGLANNANADIVYSYSTDALSYTVAAGATQTVNVYLNETLTGSSTSMIWANQGLLGAGFYVVQSGTVPTNPSILTAIKGNNTPTLTTTSSPAQPNIADGFGGANGEGSTSNIHNVSTGNPSPYVPEQNEPTAGSAALVAISTNAIYGPIGTTTATATNTTGQILIGTVTVQGGAAGTTTDYLLQTYVNGPLTMGGSGQNQNTLDYGFNDLDVTQPGVYTGANDGPFETFHIVVPGGASVPEPGSLVLTGLGVLAGALGQGWRRFRGKRATGPDGMASTTPDANVEGSGLGDGVL